MPIIPATGYHNSNCVMVFMSPNTVTTYSLTLAIHGATFVTCCSVLVHGHNYFNGPECILRGKAVVVPPDIGQLQCNMTLVVPADIVCMGVRITNYDTIPHRQPCTLSGEWKGRRNFNSHLSRGLCFTVP